MNPAIQDLIWISSDISFSIGITSHLEDMFTVRPSDECNEKISSGMLCESCPTPADIVPGNPLTSVKSSPLSLYCKPVGASVVVYLYFSHY